MNELAFFGAFNPPTLAHLSLARFAMERTGAQRVIFVPSKAVYIREEQGKDFAYRDADRAAMLDAAARLRPWMAVCTWEIAGARQPRTYETLCHLREEGHAPALLLGSDKLKELETGWLHVEEIAMEFGIVCLERGSDSCGQIIGASPFLQRLSSRIRALPTPEITRGISSTEVRKRIAGIRSLRAALRGNSDGGNAGAEAEIRRLENEIRTMVPSEIMPLLAMEPETDSNGQG